MAGPALRPRSGRSAKALLLTILGEFALPHGGTIWTSTIIDGLGALGVSERNARQAAARLAEDGLVVSERVGRAARWGLTVEGRRLLEAGARRIYGFGSSPAPWDGCWLVVYVSVAEGERASRHRLRTQLGFAGFGFLGAGVAVSPHLDREGLATDLLRELDLDAVVFVARTGSFAPDEEVIARAWDLDELGGRYRAFVDEFAKVGPEAGVDAFAAVAALVHEWRRFPFDDPEIPAELLPAGWPGAEAKRTFDERRASWLPSATAWFLEAERRSTTP